MLNLTGNKLVKTLSSLDFSLGICLRFHHFLATAAFQRAPRRKQHNFILSFSSWKMDMANSIYLFPLLSLFYERGFEGIMRFTHVTVQVYIVIASQQKILLFLPCLINHRVQVFHVNSIN